MTLCPVALAVGCKKCPIFSICPVKSLIGDFTPAQKEAPKEAPKKASKKTSKKAKRAA